MDQFSPSKVTWNTQKMLIFTHFSVKKGDFLLFFRVLGRLTQKMGLSYHENDFWGFCIKNTHLNYLKTKNFVLKRHQSQNKWFFVKIIFHHFFLKNQFWIFALIFQRKSKLKKVKILFSQKLRFKSGKWLILQILWVWNYFEGVLLIFRVQKSFWST